ncbi:glycoside hydrolase family 43 protein [Rhodohalobacter sp. 614A]|uniref:glycoside hydrolase family 43 protein n=1 Tax=Rhodohalobacter sp. 614A TaxID=2908649 RepID=UPI001F170A7B|nr:glycoside hydrolase 43 family protein [Rhodohalobacter sp. 614A]
MPMFKNLKSWFLVPLIFLGAVTTSIAQSDEPFVSDVWTGDNGDGTYTNPIIHADYSDPDVVRVGDDFYMTASSFNVVPGLPVLHSKDLVNWEIINHALPRQYPIEHFKTPRHGQGVWAPSFRYYNGEFYIYWGDPDFGIYMVKTDDPAGEWTKPTLVKEGKGLIDASPLWDDEGNAYLVHAFARSRAGINSILVAQEMKVDGTGLIGEPVLVFDGHDEHPTVEGPKFYQHGDYYYILAPAGGVEFGWQLAMRSENPLGPYEEKIVLHQGNTEINGPHQGGLVDTPNGEYWFVHFSDQGAYGRIVHLNPVHWEDDWPMMGEDINDDGIGEPVTTHQKPDVGETYPVQTPADSDEFDSNEIGLQWQWQANPEVYWAFPHGNSDKLRLFSTRVPEDFTNYWDVPHLLLQKFPAQEFTATTKLEFHPSDEEVGEETGLIIMGRDYSYLSVKDMDEKGFYISQTVAHEADNSGAEEEVAGEYVDTNELWFRVKITGEKGDVQCAFSYSTDGKDFTSIGESFKARPGGWIGAKVGIFASRPFENYDSGFADFDWFRITK